MASSELCEFVQIILPNYNSTRVDGRLPGQVAADGKLQATNGLWKGKLGGGRGWRHGGAGGNPKILLIC